MGCSVLSFMVAGLLTAKGLQWHLLYILRFTFQKDVILIQPINIFFSVPVCHFVITSVM